MRKLKEKILDVLRQGATPDQLALTLVLGTALGTFPVLGSTTALCALAALVLRLNQPLIQLVNYFVYPLQLALYLPLMLAGARWLDPKLSSLTLPRVWELLAGDWVAGIRILFWANLGAVLLWALVAGPLGTAAYFVLRAAARKIHSRLPVSSPTL